MRVINMHSAVVTMAGLRLEPKESGEVPEKLRANPALQRLLARGVLAPSDGMQAPPEGLRERLEHAAAERDGWRARAESAERKVAEQELAAQGSEDKKSGKKGG